MIWTKHSELEGKHAFLSPSKVSWINYSDEKLILVFQKHLAALRGTMLHEFASEAIKLKRKQVKNNDTVNMYINDAIRYHMRSEQPLEYSENCFGTADAIGYDETHKVLRIFDLKTGETPAHMDQLKIYAALFFLEKGPMLGINDPAEVAIDLRLYQSGEVITESPSAQEITEIMSKIVRFDRLIRQINMEE